MKKYRIIFHIDLNAFYASCEEAEDPRLKNHPIGIAKNSDRGILTTANYAARKYGVTSAMNVYEAKKRCPNIKIIPPNFSLYEEKSRLFFDYLSTFTQKLEPASIDEGYLDLTDDLAETHPLDIAKTIQKHLWEVYHLPVSIGIAPNRFLAKMASDMKKPLGITVLRKRDVSEKLWPLPIESMHGIGKKTVPDLKLIGIQTIGDLANYTELKTLRRFLGNQTESFVNKALGFDETPIDPTRRDTIHSIGNSRTYEGFIHDYENAFKALDDLTQTVVHRLHKNERAAKTISVQVRFHDFTQHSKNFSLEYHTSEYEIIMGIVEDLFEQLYETKPIHLLGVSASNLEREEHLFKQLTIFESNAPMPKAERIDKVLESINANYPKNLLNKGFKK